MFVVCKCLLCVVGCCRVIVVCCSVFGVRGLFFVVLYVLFDACFIVGLMLVVC